MYANFKIKIPKIVKDIPKFTQLQISEFLKNYKILLEFFFKSFSLKMYWAIIEESVSSFSNQNSKNCERYSKVHTITNFRIFEKL